MIKWEYKTEVIPNDSVIDYIDALNLEGDKGWQVVTEYMCADVDESVVTFMRPRPFEAEESICVN